MDRKYDLVKYYQTNSLLHSLNPFNKILIVFLTIIMIIISNNVIDYLLLGLFLITSIAWSNIDFNIYFKNLYLFRVILIILFIIGIFKNIFLIVIVKLMYLIILLTLLTLSTPPMEIIYGIEKILRIFNKILPVNIISIYICLIIRYIPLFTSISSKIAYASKLKGIHHNNIFELIKNKHYLFKRTCFLTMLKIKELKKIMYLRLYNYSYSRINYRLNKWRKIDTMLLGLNIVMLIIVMVY